jgi:hypothetical protein
MQKFIKALLEQICNTLVIHDTRTYPELILLYEMSAPSAIAL